jgi:hypothetical protein
MLTIPSLRVPVSTDLIRRSMAIQLPRGVSAEPLALLGRTAAHVGTIRSMLGAASLAALDPSHLSLVIPSLKASGMMLTWAADLAMPSTEGTMGLMSLGYMLRAMRISGGLKIPAPGQTGAGAILARLNTPPPAPPTWRLPAATLDTDLAAIGQRIEAMAAMDLVRRELNVDLLSPGWPPKLAAALGRVAQLDAALSRYLPVLNPSAPAAIGKLSMMRSLAQSSNGIEKALGVSLKSPAGVAQLKDVMRTVEARAVQAPAPPVEESTVVKTLTAQLIALTCSVLGIGPSPRV